MKMTLTSRSPRGPSGTLGHTLRTALQENLLLRFSGIPCVQLPAVTPTAWVAPWERCSRTSGNGGKSRAESTLLVCCWPCSQHPLSRCVSLWALFPEPTVGKVRAKRLEENVRSRRNCRHVYSLLAGTADITAHNPSGLFQAKLVYAQPEQKYPVARRAPCDAHAQCLKPSRLLHSCTATVYRTWNGRAWPVPSC